MHPSSASCAYSPTTRPGTVAGPDALAGAPDCVLLILDDAHHLNDTESADLITGWRGRCQIITLNEVAFKNDSAVGGVGGEGGKGGEGGDGGQLL